MFIDMLNTYTAYSGNKSYTDVYLRLCVRVLSCVQPFVTPWTIAHQAPLSMGFPGHEYWSGLPCPPPRDLLDQESNRCLLHLHIGR